MTVKAGIMTQAQLGVLIGGIIPALLFGVSGICQKWSNQHGISTGAYLVSIGIGVLCVGLALCVYNSDQHFSMASVIPAVTLGVFWGLGILLVAIAISKYGAPLSTLAPLYNMNTLVAVVGALFIFSEWKDANLVKLGFGTIMIILGGVLVSS
ncbi:MAG: glucose uptake protein GlcU [Crocinitomicaceae bacterium]|jgi:glucose uptake protein GlcU